MKRGGEKKQGKRNKYAAPTIDSKRRAELHNSYHAFRFFFCPPLHFPSSREERECVRVRSYSGTGTSELSTPVSGGGGEWRIGSQEHGAPRDLRFPPDSRCFFLSFWVSFLGRRGSCFHGDGFRSSSLGFFSLSMMLVCGKDLNAGRVHFLVASGAFGCGSWDFAAVGE